MRFFLLLLVLVSLNGCAIGNKISYDGASDLSPTIGKDIPILILFRDIRPYVLSGNKKPSFVGLTRSLYGIPYATNTQSGKPLAEDFASLITNGMSQRGFSVSTKPITLNSSDEEINAIIKTYTKESGIAMLFSLREWKTDAHFTVSIHYNVSLNVIDNNGNVMVTSRQEGVDALGEEQRTARKNLANSVKDIFGSLINDPNVIVAITRVDQEYDTTVTENVFSEKGNKEGEKSALPSNASPHTLSKDLKKEKCSVEQILKMKEMKMSNAQIKAACE